MTDKIKRMDIKEFREKGLLQEVNRQFFHPIGLALEVIIDDNTGEEVLGGIWDSRDDIEGMAYGEPLPKKEKSEYYFALFMDKAPIREKNLGWVIQPLEENNGQRN